MAEKTKRILVTGALGQIGSELVHRLREMYGGDGVVASDMRDRAPAAMTDSGPFEHLDVLDAEGLAALCRQYEIGQVYHLAAILSGVGELKPDLAYNVNMTGLKNVLDVAKEMKMSRVMVPSSIAVFGPSTPRDNTPQETLLRPISMYGVTKVGGELLCDYYWQKYGLDVRGVRYPGLISHTTLPGGGTTDYAVAIYYDAILKGSFECFVSEDTVLPMMYMPDALRALIELAQAPSQNLRYRNAYNLTALSFSAGELASCIQERIPDFKIIYKPDYHQEIADSWPRSIDDSAAAADWNWAPEYDLGKMTDDMLAELRKRLKDEVVSG
ncbi:MAG TPA: NAD-dependent epimerase/dehydratase family protein [Bacteroidetes bacterium]|nr:putative epimerase/dehydratase [bacterium BMS3Bbin04]HDO65299.1 NAD-dependent epimerase/dehydratase family protein [Bacteroidota bacterium]HEX04424.1 NAD-dependent epimerase/dehydratase family protein [Bacteroidota bacterium]